MAILNTKYYSGTDQYSDGDVEDEILAIAQSHKTLEELDQVSFPVLYHLSRVRENILNWYPFEKDAVCLEIGSGCGAITGLLSEKMKRVVSVELSKRRADINFARHEDLENLEIMVGNLNDMDFGEKFDYVVLNGVFEYAMSFTEGETPYETFLSYVKGFLKPEGVILVAIENRLGLKYFAGAPEDHTNQYYDGLNAYEGNDSVRTFSKQEWESLMRSCGLPHFRFYYPYPDYKFPQEIFADETLNTQKYGRRTWNFTPYRFALFQEQHMMDTFRKEGIMDRFANSFLIEMSQQPIEHERQVQYAKLNSDRKPSFAIGTTIETAKQGNYVRKEALCPEASAHILRMEETAARETTGAYSCLSGQSGRKEDGFCWVDYPFLAGKSLGVQAGQAIGKGDISSVRELVRDVYDNCLCEKKRADYHNESFAEVFGSEKLEPELLCVCPANIDLILDNIFQDGTQKEIIDGEWIFDFPVPAQFIIWRTINDLYASYPALEKLYPASEFYGEYNIDADMQAVFWKWATYFAEVYVGANSLYPYTTPELGFGMAQVREKFRAKEWMSSKLYVDTGSGYSEEQTVRAEAKLAGDGSFALSFDLKGFAGIQSLRWDPLEGMPCLCCLNREQTTCGDQAQALNAVSGDENGDLFLTTDPIYQFAVTESLPDRFTISGTIQLIEKEQALLRFQELFDKQRKTNGKRRFFGRK